MWIFRSLRFFRVTNPGKYEDLNRATLDVLQADLFQGLRCDFTRPIINTEDEQCAIIQSFWLGDRLLSPEGDYTFTGHYALKNNLLLRASLDSTKKLVGSAEYKLFSLLGNKFQFIYDHSQQQPLTTLLDIDLAYRDFSTSLKIENFRDFAITYLQSITPALSMGMECTWINRISNLTCSGALRYQDEKSTFIAQIADSTSPVRLDCSFIHTIRNRLSIATQMQVDSKYNSLVRIGYRYNFTGSTVKGGVDSIGRVYGVLEQMLAPGVRFVLCGDLMHSLSQYRFGIGLSLGN